MKILEFYLRLKRVKQLALAAILIEREGLALNRRRCQAVALCFLALLVPCAAQETVLMRHLGWIGGAVTGVNQVLLVGFQSSYSVQFSLPESEKDRNSWKESGINAWLLAADGIAAPVSGEPPQWRGPGITGGPGLLTASFAFRTTVRPKDLFALVLRIGESTYFFKIPPATDGLEPRAQANLDQMSNYPLEAIERFELDRVKNRKPRDNYLVAKINALKAQLLEMGIVTNWDPALKRYVAEAPPVLDMAAARDILEGLEVKILSKRPAWVITEKQVQPRSKQFSVSAQSGDRTIRILFEIVASPDLLRQRFGSQREWFPRSRAVESLGDQGFTVGAGEWCRLYFRYGNAMVEVRHGSRSVVEQFARDALQELKVHEHKQVR